MHKRAWAFLFGAALLSLFGVWLLWGQSAVEKELLKRLTPFLSQKLGRPVHIARARVHPLLLHVSFEDVRVEPLFSAKRWTIHLTPLHLRRTVPWFAFALGKSVVDSPRLALDRLPASSRKPVRPPLIFPAIRLEWRNGEVRLPEAARLEALSGLSGETVIAPSGLDLKTRGATVAGGFSLTMKAPGWREWTAEVTVKEGSLGAVQHFFPAAPGIFDGTFDGVAKMKGPWPPRFAGEDAATWSLKARVTKGGWTASQGAFPEPRHGAAPEGARVAFRGALEADAGGLRFTDVRLMNDLRLEGTVGAPLGPNAPVNFQLNGVLDLAAAHAALPSSVLRRVPLEGTADVDARIDGSVAAPRLTLNAALSDPRVAYVLLPGETRAALTAEAGRFSVNVELLGGRVTATGRTAKESYRVEARGLALGRLAEANEWGRIGGVLRGDFTLSGENVPRAEGALSVDHLEWGVHVETQPVAATFTYADGRLRLRGRENVLAVDAESFPDRWTLSQAHFELPSGLSLSAEGDIAGPERNLDLQAALTGVPLSDVPMLLKRYPAIDGRFRFEGRLTGTAKSPVFEGEWGIKDLRLVSDGPAHQGSAQARATRDGFHVSRFTFADALSGEGEWRTDGSWRADVVLSSAPASILAEILVSTKPVQGRLQGALTVAAGGDAPPSGTARLVWTDGRWDSFVFDEGRVDISLESHTLRLTGLDIQQDAGSLHAEGLIPLNKDLSGYWLSAQLRHFAAPPLVIDGELTLRDGAFASPLLFINGYAAGAVSGKIAWDESTLRLDDVDVSRVFSGRFRLNRRTGGLAGTWLLKGLDMTVWGPALPGTPPMLQNGTMEGNGTLSGTLEAPVAQHRVLWRGGRLNDLVFDAEARGRYAERRLGFDRLEARLPSGGRLVGAGVINLSSAAVALTLEAENVSWTDTLAAAGMELPWSGVYGGTLSWEGRLGAPRIAASLGGDDTRAGPVVLTAWKARVHYEERELRIDELSARTPDGLWRLKEGSRAFFTDRGEGQLHLLNDLRNVHLGPLNIFGGLEVVGRWRTVPQPTLEADLRARSLWVNQHRFEQDLARVTWTSRRVAFTPLAGGSQRLSGVVDLTGLPQVRLDNLSFTENGQRRFWMNGEVGPERWDFQLEGSDLEAGTLTSLVDLDLPVTGRLYAKLSGTGNPAAPRVDGTFEARNGAFGRLPFDRIGGEIFWNGPVVELKNLEAARRNGYLVRGGGRFPVDAENKDESLAVDLVLADGDLAVLKDLWHDCTWARGPLKGELHLRPGDDGVRMAGFLQLDKGALRARRYADSVTDINARLLLKDDALIVEELSGRVGRGRLVGRGQVLLNGLSIDSYDLALDSQGKEGIPLEVPQLSVPPGPLLKRFSLLRKSLEGVSTGRPRLSLKLTGTGEEPRLSGAIVMDDTQFTYPPQKRKGPSAMPEWFRDFVDDTTWDLRFQTGDNTWYRNEYVSAQVKGWVNIMGKRGGLLASGRVETQRGVISYLGQTFNVRRGLFEIVADTRTVVAEKAVIPYVSGEAERLVPSVDSRGFATTDVVTMVVPRAPLGQIEPRFYSRNNPDASPERVARIAVGLSAEEQLTPEERDQMLRAGLVQLLGATAAPAAGRIANRFGIDMLIPTYDSSRDETETGLLPPSDTTANVPRSTLSKYLPGTGASLGKQLNNRIFGLYKFKVDETRNQLYFRDEVELVYRLSGNLHLRASTELDTEQVLGQPPNRQAVLENQWRFEPPKRPAPEAAAPPPAVRQ